MGFMGWIYPKGPSLQAGCRIQSQISTTLSGSSPCCHTHFSPWTPLHWYCRKAWWNGIQQLSFQVWCVWSRNSPWNWSEATLVSQRIFWLNLDKIVVSIFKALQRSTICGVARVTELNFRAYSYFGCIHVQLSLKIKKGIMGFLFH